VDDASEFALLLMKIKYNRPPVTDDPSPLLNYQIRKMLTLLTLMKGHRQHYTVKKVSDFPDPRRDATNQTLPSRE
jgi:hypothetical protein